MATSIPSDASAPGTLALEITESVLIEDAEAPLELLRALDAAGARLVLDDFGTGYSSLSYLKRFPLDALKIDRSFISSLEHDEHDAAIIAAVVSIAGRLDLDVVAEGVETVEQLRALRELGCQHAQGYYFARPQPSEEIDELVRSTAARTTSRPFAAVCAPSAGSTRRRVRERGG